ncbi:protein of unknown function [Paraburkholderia kururiensis]
MDGALHVGGGREGHDRDRGVAAASREPSRAPQEARGHLLRAQHRRHARSHLRAQEADGARLRGKREVGQGGVLFGNAGRTRAVPQVSRGARELPHRHVEGKRAHQRADRRRGTADAQRLGALRHGGAGGGVALRKGFDEVVRRVGLDDC